MPEGFTPEEIRGMSGDELVENNISTDLIRDLPRCMDDERCRGVVEVSDAIKHERAMRDAEEDAQRAIAGAAKARMWRNILIGLAVLVLIGLFIWFLYQGGTIAIGELSDFNIEDMFGDSSSSAAASAATAIAGAIA